MSSFSVHSSINCWRLFSSSRILGKGSKASFLKSFSNFLTAIVKSSLLAFFICARYIMIPVGKTYIEIYFHSADKEDSLRGQGLDGLVVDEAGFLKRGRWATELRPSLSDKKGWAILIGTPKGRNEFYTFYVRGQDPEYANWMSWSFSSYVNTLPNGGYIEWSEIEALRDELPELIYRQEILAEFLEGEGVVFRNVDLSADPTLTRAREMPEKLSQTQVSVLLQMRQRRQPQHDHLQSL